jgi:signal transduction histidine kinase
MDGRVVIPSGQYGIGDRVSVAEWTQGEPVEVNDEVVGIVLMAGTSPPLDPREERYLARTNLALLYAVLGGTVFALVLGVFLARTLTRPLRELTSAIRAVTKGQLEQRITVRSRDELGELAAAFNQISADLARADQLREQMTADIAHDLRTPLTVITGYLESMRDGVLEPSAARFETMYGEAQHLQRLVQDLRTLSLADAGELSLRCRPTSPQALLERAVDAYSHRAGQKGITLSVRVEPGLPQIHVDEERMMQVLGNLVSNALRHTPDGGQIALQARSGPHAVYLIVRDTGEGIAPEALPRIFDRFYRADAARHQTEGESGLGLAIAKSVVEAHEGTISVESAPGSGSTFTIALPVDRTNPWRSDSDESREG